MVPGEKYIPTILLWIIDGTAGKHIDLNALDADEVLFLQGHLKGFGVRATAAEAAAAMDGDTKEAAVSMVRWRRARAKYGSAGPDAHLDLQWRRAAAAAGRLLSRQWR